jgi:hypothetical protein
MLNFAALFSAGVPAWIAGPVECKSAARRKHLAAREDFRAIRSSTLPIVGQLGKLRPIANRPGAFSFPYGGGRQPPRRMPSCPTRSRSSIVFWTHYTSTAARRPFLSPRERCSHPFASFPIEWSQPPGFATERAALAASVTSRRERAIRRGLADHLYN